MAIDALRTCYDTDTVTMDNGDEYINYDDAVGEIKQLPPIQSERKTGQWIQLTCDSAEWWYCSECNGRVQMNPWAKYNYCPNCGIRIKRGE